MSQPLEDSPLDLIATRIPEFADELMILFDTHDDNLSFGTAFAELADFVGDAAMRLPFPDDLVGRTMGMIEELLEALGPEIREEIAVSFLANLPLLAVTASLPWMGHHTLNALESLEEAWI